MHTKMHSLLHQRVPRGQGVQNNGAIWRIFWGTNDEHGAKKKHGGHGVQHGTMRKNGELHASYMTLVVGFSPSFHFSGSLVRLGHVATV